jgi:ERCC4-type nuclease
VPCSYYGLRQSGPGRRETSSVFVSRRGSEPLEIVIDGTERYPWTFSKAETRRENRPVGDYALVCDNRYAAVVERKTFDNLLHDLYQVRILHQALTELAGFPNPAMVVEAQYGDFFDRSRVGDDLSRPHLARLLGELPAMHPGVQMIFAGNRKMANTWTVQFFDAVRKKIGESGIPFDRAAERPPTFLSTPVRIEVGVYRMRND